MERMNRRNFLRTLIFGTLSTTMFVVGQARADDEEDDKPSSSDDSSDHGSDDTSDDSNHDGGSGSDSADHSDSSKSSDDNSSHDLESGDDSSDSSHESEDGGDHDDDQYEARNAVQNDEAVPLVEVLSAFKKQIQGQVIDVRLIRPLFHLQYRLTYIDGMGSVRRAYFDAKTGKFIR